MGLLEENELYEDIHYDWLGLGNVSKIKTGNPLVPIDDYSLDNPDIHILELMSKPEYFGFTCKYILNKELMPFQLAFLQELWYRPFPMLIGSRGLSKSFLLAVYCILKSLFSQGSKIVICGAGFRQAKVVFEYVENIWNNAPILRDMVGENWNGRPNGAKHETDKWVFRIGDSVISALPLGSGQKIRGQRASTIIAEEFACLERNTLIQTEEGLIKIKDYLDGNVNSLLNKDKGFETPEQIFKTPKTDVYKITTQNGYSFKCSSIHKVWTMDGYKLAKDLTKDDFLEMDTNDYFPDRYIKNDNFILDEKLGWILGLLVAEGTVTNRNYIIIDNTDKELIDKIIEESGLEWKYSTKEAHIDSRGWKCKKRYTLIHSDVLLREFLYEQGLDYVTAHKKTIPSGILKSPRAVVIAFLKGLFTGDGTCYHYVDKGKNRVGCAYYSVNEELIEQLQILLLKFNITATKGRRASELSKSQQYMLGIRGANAKKLFDLLKIEKWTAKINVADFLQRKPYIRPNGKKFVLSINKANKNFHIGTFDTEQEALDCYDDYESKSVPVFRVKSIELLPKQEVLYDFYLPATNSFRGNGFIHHNSIQVDIFETVVAGFAAVSADPVEKYKLVNRHRKLQKLGLIPDDVEPEVQNNQTIISGTAYYTFNHFYEYWKRWKAIIESKGDPFKLKEIFPTGTPKNFNWKDYSIIRMPFEKLPEGFMDEKTVAKQKATINSGVYMCEYSAVFTGDSAGFFKRSLIEQCVVGKVDSPIVKDGEEVIFSAKLIGNPGMRYIIAVDPAAVNDNFSITVLEIWPNHRRIVYAWTTNKKKHAEQVKLGVSSENDYYGYCARKIRNLLQRFPSEHIAIDSQGGGGAIIEALHANDRILPGELAIWPVVEKDKPKESDRFEGLHIIDIINFASAIWVSEANHGLRYDLEHKLTLFPMFDFVALGVAMEQDKICARVLDEDGEYIAVYDTLEDTFMEIESLKDELATIVHSQTGKSGRDHWDTPEIKIGEKKGRMRKDRYSSLLMANAVARKLQEESLNEGYLPEFTAYGGFACDLVAKKAPLGASQGRGPKKYLEFMKRSLGHLG
jgi:intein/homing endonuclease